MSIDVFEEEGRGDRHGFAASRFDQQVVKASLSSEPGNFLKQILMKGAADTSIRHLDELLFVRSSGTTGHQRGINVDLAHIVHDHRHALAFAVRKNMIQQRCLPSAEKAREHGYGQTFLHDARVPQMRIIPISTGAAAPAAQFFATSASSSADPTNSLGCS